jgi:hypothetical protein
MVYAMVDDQLNILKLYSEKELANVRKLRTIYVKDTKSAEMKFNGNYGSSTVFPFYDINEAKIVTAIKQIQGLKKEAIYNEKNEWKINENFKSIEKTQEWLDKKEKIFPEYFV